MAGYRIETLTKIFRKCKAAHFEKKVGDNRFLHRTPFECDFNARNERDAKTSRRQTRWVRLRFVKYDRNDITRAHTRHYDG